MSLHIMSQHLCLFSLILQGLHEEGECRQLEFWAGKGSNIRDLFCTTPKVLKLQGASFRMYKKYWAKEVPEGGHPPSTRVGGAPYPPRHAPLPRGPPGSPLMPIFGYMESFVQEKIISKLTGRNSATTRRNQSRAPAELFCRGNFPPGGGNHHHRSSHREGVNLHQHLHQHHLLSNPNSSLVSNLCTKTSDWYLWVASSVDYSL